MSWVRRIFIVDEELGKKDDDHRPAANGTGTSSAWAPRKTGPNFRKRRIVYALFAILFVYLFVKNIPTDLGPNSNRADSRTLKGNLAGTKGEKKPLESTEPPSKKPPRPQTPSQAELHYHEGPIKFYMLAASLYPISNVGGQYEFNKNILFAASNLKSVSEIMPLACEMARRKRNNVHFAIFGRDDLEIQEIRKINGAIDDCNVYFHDSRPDYSRWSTDFRMEVSVMASLGHIQTFVHPQVIITDDPSREDIFFVDAVRSKAKDIGKSLIELPQDATESMMWLTRLDSGALAAWSKIYVDVLIQAPPASSGSLVRLLKSIQGADYFGIRRPHLTIELPAEIDPPTWGYLNNLVWPPLDLAGSPHASQVTLRHRIPRQTTTAEEASARLVESFYPIRNTHSHVLLLSPQVELSPLYYHYLFYNLLEYKYSDYILRMEDAATLMGISLELPTSHLNDSAPLEPPAIAEPEKASTKGQKSHPRESTPFRWQAPNSNAALYFGDKWMEYHSFLTARLSKPPTNFPKVISPKHPAWLEYLLELMRARGYSLLYPSFLDSETSIATIHDELYQIPEEFSKPKGPDTPSLQSSDVLSADDLIPPPNTEKPLLTSNLISILADSGDLPDLNKLPLLSYSGDKLSSIGSINAAASFTSTFRYDTGACKSPQEVPSPQPHKAVDLFCRLDEVYDHLAASVGHTQNLKIPSPSKEQGNNEDAIQPDNKANAQEEATAHLLQQGGFTPTDVTLENKADSDESSQIEFRAQMERQKGKPVAADTRRERIQEKFKEADAKQEDPMEKDSAPDRGASKKEEPKKEEAKQNIPTHGSFNLEKPKQPAEETLEASKGKGPGW